MTGFKNRLVRSPLSVDAVFAAVFVVRTPVEMKAPKFVRAPPRRAVQRRNLSGILRLDVHWRRKYWRRNNHNNAQVREYFFLEIKFFFFCYHLYSHIYIWGRGLSPLLPENLIKIRTNVLSITLLISRKVIIIVGKSWMKKGAKKTSLGKTHGFFVLLQCKNYVRTSKKR